MDSNLTDKFIGQLYELSKANISIADIQKAKNCLLDYLGATFSGAHIMKGKGYKMQELLHGDGNYPLIGFNQTSSIQSSVFINGLSSHVAELDDGVISGSVHPGSPLFSALIPVAKRENISGKDLIIGALVGYEAIIRLANTVQPSHKKKGYHATATCGAIGTAVGIAAMLGVSKKQMKNAFSAAVISAGGSLKAIEDNSEYKPFNVGNAAMNGLMALSMAKAGFEGPNDALSGQRGFLSLMSNEPDELQLFKNKDEALAINKVYVKPYAACRYCHPAIDATLAIRNKHFLKLDEIENIQVKTYELAVYNHDHIAIDNISLAKMSIPYSVAVAMKTGKAGIEEFTNEYINDAELSDLTKKVQVLSDKEFTSYFPNKSIGSVEITTMKGEKITKKVEYPKGEPENPLNETELQEKFKALMNYAGKSKTQSENIMNIVFDLDNKLSDMYPLL